MIFYRLPSDVPKPPEGTMCCCPACGNTFPIKDGVAFLSIFVVRGHLEWCAVAFDSLSCVLQATSTEGGVQ